MPAVSVVTAAYDAERYVGEAIESVLGQRFGDLELIVVDDGSSDRTSEIAESYRDERLVSIRHERNRGYVHALNTGLERASGDLVAIHDADDVALPDRLERQVALLGDRPELAVVGSAVETIDSNGMPLGLKRLPASDTQIRWRALFTMPFVHSTMTFRGGLVRDQGLRYDVRLRVGGMDHRLAAALLEHGRGANDPRPLVQRRMHESQTTAVAFGAQQADSDSVTAALVERLGIAVTLEQAHLLREFFYRPPHRLDPAQLSTVALVLDVFEAFRRQPRLDAAEVRAIRRGLIDTILARGRAGGLRPLVADGLLRRLVALDPSWTLTAPARYAVRSSARRNRQPAGAPDRVAERARE